MSDLDLSDDTLFERWITADTNQTFEEWAATPPPPRYGVANLASNRMSMLPGAITYIQPREALPHPVRLPAEVPATVFPDP